MILLIIVLSCMNATLYRRKYARFFMLSLLKGVHDMTIKTLALAAALIGATAFSAQADVKATQGFIDFGVPSVDTGDISTATSFTIGKLVSVPGNNSGVLAGLPSQTFGPVTFRTASDTSLSFGNPVFGTFASSSIKEISNVAGAVAFYILGDWKPGSYPGGTGPDAGSFTISFTQTNRSISDSATFAVPPSGVIPELSTWAMVGIGFASLGFAAYRSSRKTARIVV